MTRAVSYQLLVMGVAGCGKSTLAAELARALGGCLIEGDDYHPASNQDKMRQGIALTDADREPWLADLGALVAASRGGAVLTCSALKRRYRDQLRAAAPSLATVFLEIASGQAQARVAARAGHLFPASLVQSQFEALEPPVDEPRVLRVEAAQPVSLQLDAVLRWLDHSARHDTHHVDPVSRTLEEKLS